MMGTIRGYIMMKRNLIALALLLIVAIAFLAVPVSAILTLSSGNDAKIITTDGEMTYTFIADPPIPTGKGQIDSFCDWNGTADTGFRQCQIIIFYYSAPCCASSIGCYLHIFFCESTFTLNALGG